ncbi:MAG: hypothetical protein MHPSP_001503, partial [Paramarteilia canceri]
MPFLAINWPKFSVSQTIYIENTRINFNRLKEKFKKSLTKNNDQSDEARIETKNKLKDLETSGWAIREDPIRPFLDPKKPIEFYNPLLSTWNCHQVSSGIVKKISSILTKKQKSYLLEQMSPEFKSFQYILAYIDLVDNTVIKNSNSKRIVKFICNKYEKSEPEYWKEHEKLRSYLETFSFEALTPRVIKLICSQKFYGYHTFNCTIIEKKLRRQMNELENKERLNIDILKFKPYSLIIGSRKFGLFDIENKS